MADALGLLVQPQPVLLQIVVGVVQGPLLQAHVVFNDRAQVEEVVAQLFNAAEMVWPVRIEQAAVKTIERTWGCKLGDDCTCARFSQEPVAPDISAACCNYQGHHHVD